MKQDQH